VDAHIESLTEYDSVSGRPTRGVCKHPDTLEHDADGKGIVCCTRRGQGTVQMCIDQDSMLFALGSAVRYADDDVGEVCVGLVQPFTHHVEPGVSYKRDTAQERRVKCKCIPMTPAASLMPHLALQLATRLYLRQTLALTLDLISRLDHPFIREGMFSGSNSAISNVFGKVSGVFEDLSFRNLWKACF
jgi:hypothetical protein